MTNNNEKKKVNIGNVTVGGDKIVIMAGPCTVEGRDQIVDISKFVMDQGASVIRGGAFKQRTSPDTFRGLGDEAMKYLDGIRKITGLPVVSEITSPSMVEKYMDMIDCFQVGAKNMQNFDLLVEIGRSHKPVLLKNGHASTYQEFINAAGYIQKEGNDKVIMCYRGIRTFETMTRYTFDVSAIPILKKETGLPVIADPSHSAGASTLVKTLSDAAIVAGADGLLIEVHNEPEKALCDGEQSLDFTEFEELMDSVRKTAQLIGRFI